MYRGGGTALVVAGLMLAAAFLRGWAASTTKTPWVMTDELVYAELARSLARSGEFLVRGEGIGLPTSTRRSSLRPGVPGPPMLRTRPPSS